MNKSPIRFLLGLAVICLAAKLLTGCENPVTHFTDPDKGEQIVIPACPADTLQEPLPPGHPDDERCRAGSQK